MPVRKAFATTRGANKGAMVTDTALRRRMCGYDLRFAGVFPGRESPYRRRAQGSRCRPLGHSEGHRRAGADTMWPDISGVHHIYPRRYFPVAVVEPGFCISGFV